MTRRPTVRIMVSRHSAFYSPVISTIAAGFLKKEGLESTYRVLKVGEDAQELIRRNEVDIVQSAVSSAWVRMEKGKSTLAKHFAQINRRDGFFLAARKPDPEFNWKQLEEASLLADHGWQPLAMLKYAAHLKGVDWTKIDVIDAGSVEEIDAAFRSGRGDYVHQQGPAPQQLERESLGFIVASVGEAMPPVAFSSLMASSSFLKSAAARSFMKAYREAREWTQHSQAEEVARMEAGFFPNTDPEALSAAIAQYQGLGCWAGEPSISRDDYKQALDVFFFSGQISRRHPYEDVVADVLG